MRSWPARILLVSLLLTPAARAQEGPFYPIEDVRPGMKGIGRTVFQGMTIEEFGVEVLGVLKNFAPRQDMILARLSGGPLDRTGVVQGMSGSPVYIEGQLLGAVAFAFNFSKEPIAGIQPITQMIRILDRAEPEQQAASGAPRLESPRAFVHRLLDRIAQGLPVERSLVPEPAGRWSGPEGGLESPSLTRIGTPLFLSGLSPLAIRQFSSVFSGLGLNPVQMGGTGSAPYMTSAEASTVVPGSAVNAELVRGDITVSANGTVTHVDGDRVYAFGHPFLSTGPTDIPMSTSYVISVLPNLASSFRIAVPLEMVGSFKQDRSTGVYGRMGDQPEMIPVTVKVVSSRNTVNLYSYDVVSDRFLTPFLMNFTIFNAITASERALGEMTLEVSGTIHLSNSEPVEIRNAFAGDVNGPAVATVAAVAPIAYLLTSGYDDLVIEGIDLEIMSTDRKKSVQLDRIAVDRTEVRPGESVELTAYLRGANGEEFVEAYSVEVPAGIGPGQIQLLVGDGRTITRSGLLRNAPGAPKNSQQVVKELNRLRKNDRLYIKVMSSSPSVVIGGEELPSLPPSMLAVVNTSRSSSQSVVGVQNSTVREYELPPSNYVIQGQRTLNLTIAP